MKKWKLNLQQERFCQEYLLDGNATRALKMAGYKYKVTPNNAWQMLHNEKVQGYLQEQRELMRERFQVDRDTLVRELMFIAFADMGDYLDEKNEPYAIASLPPEKRRAIASFRIVGKDAHKMDSNRVIVRLHDKIEAIKELSKLLGFTKPQPVQNNFLKQIIIQPVAPLPDGNE